MTRALRTLLLTLTMAAAACGTPPERTTPEGAAAARRADPREAEVLDVVQRFFDTMTARDAGGAEALLVMEGQFNSLRVTESNTTVRTTAIASYVEGLASGTPRQVERMWDPIVLVDDRIAMVWTPYDFHNDDALSHCGIDIFSLVRTDDGWRIANVTYTVEPNACARLGQPGPGRP